MDTIEIKACLKKARDALREKDFKEALKQSKAVLGVDKDNYNALVFIGLAAEGLNQPDQALKAFRRASEKDPDQLLAWQGLSSFFDKNPTVVGTDEAIIIYQRLLALTLSDCKKQIVYAQKLVDLYLKSNKKEKALELLEHLLDLQKAVEERVTVLKQIINTWSHDLPHSTSNLYQSALTEILQHTAYLTKDEISTFIEQLLCQMSKVSVDSVKILCTTFNENFPDAFPPKEYLLRFYLETNIGVATVPVTVCEQVAQLIEQLISIKPDSLMIQVAQGFLELQRNNFVKANNLLQVCDADNISGLYYLGFTNLCLHKYQQCLEVCNKGLTALSSPSRVFSSSLAHVDCLFKLAMAEAYREINTLDSREKAFSILEEVSERMPNEAFLIKAYVYLDQGKVDDAQTCANYLPQDSLPVQTLKATILFAKKDFMSALQILKKIVAEDPSDFRTTLKLGQTLWELRNSQDIADVKEQCFNTLLKAAKLDPLHFESFLYLGYFYRDIQRDKTKARRCFQKAYDLNSASTETGIALVDSLMEEEEQTQCVRILEQATSQAAAGHAKWAWLRLGLYQIKQNDFDAAIISLQSALRGDPQDNHVWECLAEAYLQRGSYNAALKAFTKASELDPNSLYCQYKIANIKHVLGEMAMAIIEYKKILEKSPDYVPVLKGVSESLIQLGKHKLLACLDDLAKGCFEEAIVFLTRAAAQRPDLSCIWKLLGDACTLIYPIDVEPFSVPVKLLKKTTSVEELKLVTKSELLRIGSSCYGQALKIFPESGSLWHDLGVNLYHQSQLLFSNDDSGDGLTLLDRASQALKKAINLEPKDWRHWNVLGVIACCSACDKPSLAQHCFIKSLECEANNVVAWTNLGTFYLSKNNVELAYNAFKNAQSIDPTYVACWIGQAMIAETVQSNEAMDLFRHSSELGFNLESSLGYSQWVLKVLGDASVRKTDVYHYSIQQMAAVPAASDDMTRYTRRIKKDPVAYNMQGLLFEHQNLLDSSVSAFQKAISLLKEGFRDDSESYLNDVQINLARVLSKQGKYEESIQLYETCSMTSDVQNTCFYGLTLFKAGRIKDAFNVYSQVLTVVPGMPEESQVYAALGMVAYKTGDKSQAKTLLFSGFQTSQPSLHGLLALCALGLLQKDMTLSAAVLEEVYKREDKEEVLKEISLLKLYSNYLQDSFEEGLIELKQVCETTPALTSLLGQCLLSSWTKLTKSEILHSILQFLCLRDSRQENDPQFDLVQTLSQLLVGQHHRKCNDQNVLKTAQKAFHANPGCHLALSNLAAAVHAEAVVMKNSKCSNLFQVEQGLLNILLEDNRITPELRSWCLQMFVVNCIERKDIDSAQMYLKRFQEGHTLSTVEEMFYKSITSYLTRKINPLHEISDSRILSRLQLLVDCELCCHHNDYQTAINMLDRLIQQTETQNCCSDSILHNLKERLAYIAFCGLKDQPESLNFKKKFEEILTDMKDSPILLIMDAYRALAANDNRKAKFLFATALDKVSANEDVGFCSSLARQWLLKLSWGSTKEQDQNLIQNILQDAKSRGDSKTVEMFQSLSAK
ncbi:tetratricopeptide repeat protein 37-like [Biomphalaria glabrata]|uniref:Tetratricopeptide repeat protein 37-like n=1 Tax=Biomphalaria glabrata TaxID=6526 RepID=A0A9W2ZGF2_BIOGL|nr:tetratricopeptide repeat protein 37-like [Biomphalaria glabrata]XP_055874019.1 tetratricopeptide repeat protein 37-like [Biomphalaria glabrata]XP_055874020.1 tetratricopeptide repeat protein 37-like [Biomphalaria glabrata]XP_055874021.1 tetratricopeptide repeat protein 37-like [Biomphalaria glabrata]